MIPICIQNENYQVIGDLDPSIFTGNSWICNIYNHQAVNSIMEHWKWKWLNGSPPTTSELQKMGQTLLSKGWGLKFV